MNGSIDLLYFLEMRTTFPGIASVTLGQVSETKREREIGISNKDRNSKRNYVIRIILRNSKNYTFFTQQYLENRKSYRDE